MENIPTETSVRKAKGSNKKFKRVGLGVVAVAALVGISTLVVALVNNSASADDSNEAKEENSRHEGAREGSKRERHNIGIFLGIGDDDSERGVCAREAFQDVLGINPASPDVSLRTTIYTNPDREISVVLSDGDTTVELTKSNYAELVNAIKECPGAPSMERLERWKQNFRDDDDGDKGDASSEERSRLRNFFLDEGEETNLKSCINGATSEVLGLNPDSSDLAREVVVTREGSALVVSDGATSVTITPELQERLIDSAKDCFKEWGSSFGERLDKDLSEHGFSRNRGALT